MTAAPSPAGGWSDESQVAWYIDRIGKVEARRVGEAVLVDALPPAPQRILDLGCGDGSLAALVLANRSSVTEAVAIDRSPPMLERATSRFADDARVQVRAWDLRGSISPLGEFDVIVSGFAIHHLEDERKRALFAEVGGRLKPGGRFLNLEVVQSPSEQEHLDFLTAIGRTADDPEDRLASVEDQVAWMSAAGLEHVSCLWRWRGFAVLVGSAASGGAVGTAESEAGGKVKAGLISVDEVVPSTDVETKVNSPSPPTATNNSPSPKPHEDSAPKRLFAAIRYGARSTCACTPPELRRRPLFRLAREASGK